MYRQYQDRSIFRPPRLLMSLDFAEENLTDVPELLDD
jgi:hypothetical protein